MCARFKALSVHIHRNRNIAQVFSFLMAISIYALAMLNTVNLTWIFYVNNSLVKLLQISLQNQTECLNRNSTPNFECSNISTVNFVTNKDCKFYFLVDVSILSFIHITKLISLWDIVDILLFFNFFQYILLLVLLSMIACAVYQVLISLCKTIILIGGMVGFMIVYISYSKNTNQLVCLTMRWEKLFLSDDMFLGDDWKIRQMLKTTNEIIRNKNYSKIF